MSTSPRRHWRGIAALQGSLWEGAVGAADWGRENRVESLPPPALRAGTSLAEGGKGDPYPLARRDTWVPPYGLRYARPCRFFDSLKCPPRKGRLTQENTRFCLCLSG